MHIGLAGPIQFASLLSLLSSSSPLPVGLGGLPVVHLTQEYLRRGHQVTVFTLDREITVPRWIEGDRLRIFVGPYRAIGRARDLFTVERIALEQAIRESDVPFIHAHWTYEFALAALASGRPTLVTAHDAPLKILALNPSPYRILRTIMATHVFRKAKQLSAVSPYIVQHMRLMGFHKPIDLVPNGMEMSHSTEASICTRQGGPAFTAILNGDWQGRKNGRRLLQAFSIVHHALPQTTLTLYGAELSEGSEAQAWANSHNITAGVHWKGYRPHAEIMQALRHNTDVLVHPALEESFGLTILEAMSLGLPVVAGRRSGAVPWVTDYGRGALLVDVASVDALALGMLRLATESEFSMTLAQHGQAYAQEHFSLKRVGDQYQELYQRLL